MPHRMKETEVTFRIGGLNPESIPMARQAEYIAAFAQLIGEREGVHFVRIRKGSNTIVARIEKPLVQKVVTRLKVVRSRAEQDESFRKVRQMLSADETPGTIRVGTIRLIHFPRPILKERVGPVSQLDYLDGTIVRIGGFDETIPVHIKERDGTPRFCTANLETAKRLKPFLLGEPVRLIGMAQWYRERNGEWRLPEFVIRDFEAIDARPLREALNEISGGNGSSPPLGEQT
jgi:hypothetical protein